MVPLKIWDVTIVKIPVVPQGSGDRVIMVELGSDCEEDGGQQSNIPSTLAAYLNSQAILSQQLQAQWQAQETKVEVLDQIHDLKNSFYGSYIIFIVHFRE